MPDDPFPLPPDPESLPPAASTAGGSSPPSARHPLVELLSDRGHLRPGEVVTLGVPLARALADLHARGMAHGRVRAGSVAIDPDGRPVLDLRGASVVGAGVVGAGVSGAGVSGAGAAQDVYDLASLCWAAAGQQGPAALREALAPALAQRPEDRPSAATLGAHLLAVCAPAPLQLPRSLRTPSGPPQPRSGPLSPTGCAQPPPGRHRRRRLRFRRTRLRRNRLWAAWPGRTRDRPGPPDYRRQPRRSGALLPAALLVVLLAGLLALPGVASLASRGRSLGGTNADERGHDRTAVAGEAPGTAWAADPGSAAPGSAPPGPAPPGPGAPGRTAAEDPHVDSLDWVRVLGDLDRLRARAYATGDHALLAAVYAPGSPALARETSRMHQLRGAGLHAERLLPEVDSARLIRREQGRVVLHVVDRLPAHELVDTEGAVRAQRPGRGHRSWQVTVARSGDRWLVADVAAGGEVD